MGYLYLTLWVRSLDLTLWVTSILTIGEVFIMWSRQWTLWKRVSRLLFVRLGASAETGSADCPWSGNGECRFYGGSQPEMLSRVTLRPIKISCPRPSPVSSDIPGGVLLSKHRSQHIFLTRRPSFSDVCLSTVCSSAAGAAGGRFRPSAAASAAGCRSRPGGRHATCAACVGRAGGAERSLVGERRASSHS